MSLRLPLALLLLAASGCERAASAPQGPAEDAGAAPRLLQQVRAGLAARDAKLQGYRFEGHVREEGEPAPLSFSFAYRAPASMRGSLGAPASRTFAYDGEQLYEQHDGERRLTTYRFALPPATRAGFLTEVFAPFLPEGFRVPLLPQAGVSAEATAHALAAQAVRLRAPLPGHGEVEYLLRWPALDFLGKRVRSAAPGAPPESELRVEAEQCDARLGLCVPRRLSRWVAGRRVGETELGEVQLNPALPSGAFRLAAPAGYEARSQTLVPPEAAGPAR